MQRVVDGITGHVSRRTRRRVMRGRLAVRRLSADHRVLPDFLIIGAMRCGTSSLYKYLGYHPRVVPSLRKETEWFTRLNGEDERFYRAHFPLAARMGLGAAVGRPLLSFEATPDYLYAPHAHAEVRRLLPEARLIVMLRDPVERAYSHFQHSTRHGWEDADFAEALRREESRTAADLTRMTEDPRYWGGAAAAYSYVGRGLYADQLTRWYSSFGRDQILVLASEELYRDPATAYAEVLHFLGLPSWQPQFRNYSIRDASGQPMDPGVREGLTDRFRVPNRQLFELLGRDLGWNHA